MQKKWEKIVRRDLIYLQITIVVYNCVLEEAELLTHRGKPYEIPVPVSVRQVQCFHDIGFQCLGILTITL